MGVGGPAGAKRTAPARLQPPQDIFDRPPAESDRPVEEDHVFLLVRADDEERVADRERD